MPVTRLYLIRHGQSAKNVEGRFGGHSLTPLSELGVSQAEITAKTLKKEKISVIYSSDLPRAIETAKPASKLLDVYLNKTKAFRERDVGVLEGLTFNEAKEKYPRDYHDLVCRNINEKITDGESYRELLKRATGALSEVLSAYRGKRIAIYSHTGTICFLSLYLMGAINKSTVSTPWLATSNCGINRFEIRGKRNIRVVALNDTRHLVEPTGNDSFAAT
ncbi:MAG: histidine phosphatase family protein [Pyrinomonadaceae bacterium]|nr:histidine phosphatase family protein [Pyrinomonadaceae bacterium]